MSEKKERQVGSIDISIADIPDGQHQVKIIGLVVSKTTDSIIISDATGQITAKLYRYPSEINIKERGRFLVRLTKNENLISAELLGFHSMSMEQITQYQKIVKLEKRIPDY